MLVSIIIPCYNSEKYLRSTVNTVLTQSYENIELILINDGSKDGTWDIIQDIQRLDSRVRGYTQENKGVSAARNLGIKLSNGDFLTFLDSDDTYEKDKIKLQVDSLRESKAKLCYCGNKYIYENKVINHVYNDEGKILKGYILNTLMIHLNDWMVEASLIKENNIMFPESFRYGEDVNFFMKVLALSEAVSVNKQLTNYFIRSNSSSFNSNIRNNDEDNYINDFKLFLKNNKNIVYSTEEVMEVINLLDNYLLPQVIIRNIHYLNKKYKQLSPYEREVISKFKLNFGNLKSSLRFYQFLIKAKLYP